MQNLRNRILATATILLAAAPWTASAQESPESEQIRTIVVGARASAVENIAADFLTRFLSESTEKPIRVVTANVPQDRSIVLAGPGSRRTMPSLVSDSLLERMGDEGFSIVQKRMGWQRFAVIAGATDRGVMYGAFDMARRIGAGQDPWMLSAFERPAFPFRCLWSWSQPTARQKAFFNYEEMTAPIDSARYQRFGELLAMMHVNAFCFWGRYGELDDRPAEELKTIRTAYRNFTDFLKQRYCIDSYVFMIYGRGDDFSQLCVHNEAVQKRWHARVENLCRLYPNVKGIIMAGAGGDWVRAPWECRCEECVKHTDRELILAAMEMIGAPLRERGGRLIWKAVTDRPTLVKSEVEHFAGLGEILPDYVNIAFKTFYKDFRPPHPYNPQFYQLPVKPPNRAPYVTEFQILGEYRGLDQFPCSMASRWEPIFDMVQERNQEGVIGVVSAEPGPYIDHPLNGINWYAFGRWCWNPREPLEQVMEDWARLEFGEQSVRPVVAVLKNSYRASISMMFGRGIMTQNHSRLPSINYELESSLIGPWHDIPRAPEGEIGRAHDLSMYPPQVAKRIQGDILLRLFAHRLQLTDVVASELMREKDAAVQYTQEMVDTWSTLKGEIPDEKYYTILRGLQDNRVDAELWKRDLQIFLDYKLGKMTRDRLVLELKQIREEFPNGGSLLSSGEPLKQFLSEWEAVANGTFKRRVMEGKYYSPPVADFPPGLAEDK